MGQIRYKIRCREDGYTELVFTSMDENVRGQYRSNRPLFRTDKWTVHSADSPAIYAGTKRLYLPGKRTEYDHEAIGIRDVYWPYVRALLAGIGAECVEYAGDAGDAEVHDEGRGCDTCGYAVDGYCREPNHVQTGKLTCVKSKGAYANTYSRWIPKNAPIMVIPDCHIGHVHQFDTASVTTPGVVKVVHLVHDSIMFESSNNKGECSMMKFNAKRLAEELEIAKAAVAKGAAEQSGGLEARIQTAVAELLKDATKSTVCIEYLDMKSADQTLKAYDDVINMLKTTTDEVVCDNDVQNSTGANLVMMRSPERQLQYIANSFGKRRITITRS